MNKEEQVMVNLMEKLGCSEEEAVDIMKWDKEIDKGGKAPFDLTKEQEKSIKKYVNVKRECKKPTVYKFETRERKANPTKAGIIAEIAEFLTKNSEFATENVEITNKERQIAFKIGENAFEITLVQKRKPKN